MKNIKYYTVDIPGILLLQVLSTAKAQKTADEIKKMVESKSFVFTGRNSKARCVAESSN